MAQRFCLTLDLENDAAAIAAYDDWHRVGRTPAPVIASIRDAGIDNMEIFRLGNRLVMIVDARDGFTFERKAAMDAANPAVVEWEERMLAYQRPSNEGEDGGKWRVMRRMFDLRDHPDPGRP